jgi:hypothetical protein
MLTGGQGADHSHVRETLAAPEQPDQRRMIRSTADTRDRQENR